MLHRNWLRILVLPIVPVVAPLCAQDSAVWHDPSPHKVQFVTVDENVRLEVLDWGGVGRPIVLLAGMGNTAHVFDDFAPKLTGSHHVYGITRRGFGASSVPAAGYDAYRLGDDVIAVLDSLKLTKPVLAGHSFAGEELSSVGSRHPDRVAGLAYLEAAYAYAFDNGKGPTDEELFKAVQGMPSPPPPGSANLASFSALRAWQKQNEGFAVPESELRQTRESTPDGGVGKRRTSPASGVVREGMKKFTDIPVPVLAICAVPQDTGAWIEQINDPAVKTLLAKLGSLSERSASAFEGGVPSARVVRLPHASHYVFISNEADVLREMNAFLQTLK